MPNQSTSYQQVSKQKLIKIHKKTKEDNADNLINPHLPPQNIKSLTKMHELR